MKRLLMAIMGVAMAVTFSAPSFAGEEIKGSHVLVYGEEQKEKKDDKKGGHADTFADKKDDKKKKDEKKEERPK